MMMHNPSVASNKFLKLVRNTDRGIQNIYAIKLDNIRKKLRAESNRNADGGSMREGRNVQRNDPIMLVDNNLNQSTHTYNTDLSSVILFN